MSKFSTFVEHYQLGAKKYDYQKNARILTLDSEKVVIKEKRKNISLGAEVINSSSFGFSFCRI